MSDPDDADGRTDGDDGRDIPFEPTPITEGYPFDKLEMDAIKRVLTHSRERIGAQPPARDSADV